MCEQCEKLKKELSAALSTIKKLEEWNRLYQRAYYQEHPEQIAKQEAVQQCVYDRV